MKRILIFFALVAVLFCTGCSSWEQKTYQTLAADKAVIDCAAAGYNHDDVAIAADCHMPDGGDAQAYYLDRTATAHDVIAKARQVHNTAVDAFFAYENVKLAGAGQDALQQAEQKVITAIGALAPVLADIHALSNPSPPPATNHATTLEKGEPHGAE